jgi:integrase
VKNNPWGDGFAIWGDSRGKPLSESIILRHFYEGLAGIGITPEERKRRKLNFHAWRHFYNSNIRPFVPDYQLRMLTGHSSATMTDRYTEVTVEQRKAIAKIADRLLGGDAAGAAKMKGKEVARKASRT